MSQPVVYYPNQKNDCLIFLSFNYMEIKDLAFNINFATDERLKSSKKSNLLLHMN